MTRLVDSFGLYAERGVMPEAELVTPSSNSRDISFLLQGAKPETYTTTTPRPEACPPTPSDPIMLGKQQWAVPRVPEAANWSCSACTYANVLALQKCAMCHTPRPQSKGPESTSTGTYGDDMAQAIAMNLRREAFVEEIPGDKITDTEFPPGKYVTTATAVIRSGLEPSTSDKLGELPQGAQITIVEVQRTANRIRRKLQTVDNSTKQTNGGWISLMDTSDGYTWVRAFG